MNAEPRHRPDIRQDPVDDARRALLVAGLEDLTKPGPKCPHLMEISLAGSPAGPAPVAVVVSCEEVSDVRFGGQSILVRDRISGVDKVNRYLHRSVAVMRKIHLTPYRDVISL